MDEVAKKVVNEHDRDEYMYIPMRGKMVILHPRELLLTYRDNSGLSVLRAADRNINNLFVGSVKQVNK